jgi:uncharacterized protein (TIGR04255 family)
MEEDRTLTKNRISKFVLRLDLFPNASVDYKDLANNIGRFFDRIEQRPYNSYSINNQTQDIIKQEGGTDYVLVKESPSESVILSANSNVIAFETNQYTNNLRYKEFLSQVIAYFKGIGIDIQAKRIGMRFINEYPCKDLADVKKTLDLNSGKNICQMASKEFISRAISQEEFNFSTSKLRVQYGIPNKFYPAPMNNFDLLLDIDSWTDISCTIDNLPDVCSALNHKAYEYFVTYLRSKLLETLK